MTLPVGSLMNMEMALYGGSAYGFDMNCPSYINGYTLPNNNYGNYFGNQMYSQNNPFQYQNPYNNFYSNPFYQNSQAIPQAPIAQQGQTNTAVQGSASDINTLAEYYKQNNNMKQEWSGLASSAAMIALFEKPQTMIHFVNSGKALKPTNKLFDLSNPAMKALWEKNPDLMQKAYGSMHQINRAAQSKIPVLQKWFQKPMDETSRKYLEEIMEKALKSGDEKAILRATETLNAARGCDGYIPTAWNKVKNFFGFEARNYTPQERIARKSAEIDKLVNAPAAVRPGVKGLLKQGLKEGKTFAIFGLVIDLPKIFKAAKLGGADSALKQVGQTGIRSLIDGIGWTLGRAAGTAVGTKVGAALGTMICPGVGTAIGAALGFLGGAAGSILASKLSHKLIPVDESVKLEAEENKKTQEGRSALIQFAMQRAQSGEAVPQNVLISAQNAALAMGM